MKARLRLHAIELEVFLGWSEEERLQKQRIWVDIAFHFQQPPSACMTDELNHTICYDTLITKIKNHVYSRHFRLIEYLARDLYDFIKQSIDIKSSVGIQLTKKPAVNNLQDGVTFFYGDEWLS